MRAVTFRKPSSYSRICIYVDSITTCELSGRLFFYNSGKELQFHDVIEMIRLIDQAFNSAACPQSSVESRSFGKKAKTANETRDHLMEEPVANIVVDKDRENKATFIIHVKYRQNATWQGEIKWVNKNKVQYFRSSLEMIKLMDTALAEEFGREVEVSWEE